MFQIFGIIFRYRVAMELPCEICAAKTPPKSKLIEIGGRCFLGSASVLFDTDVTYRGLIGSVLEYGKDTHAEFGKGSIPGIEDCMGLMGSTGGKIRILELQIPCCCFLLIRPPFEAEAWSAGSAEHGSLHQGIYSDVLSLDIVPSKSFTRHELPAPLW
jgi:hypothetical protein